MDTPGEGSRHWRGRLWRARARTAFGLTFLVGLGLWLVARDIGFILIAGAAVMFPIWLVAESWLALRAETVGSTWLDRVGNTLATGLALVAGFAYGYLRYEGARSTWAMLAIPLALLAGFAVLGIYRWRDARAKPAGLLTATFPRISREGAFVHFASYIIALAAAFVAAAFFHDWSSRSAAYLSGAYGGKLVADFVFAKPPPLDDERLSGALMRMTALSPLWWGLPWGVLVMGFLAATAPGEMSTLTDIASVLPMIFHLVIAVTLAFALVTVMAYAQEYGEWRRGYAAGEVGEGRASWIGLFCAVTALALAAYSVAYVPFWRSDEQRFGIETWTCAKEDGRSAFGWIAKSGVKIRSFGEYGYLYLSDISCVPRPNGKACDNDKEGWDEIEILVRGADGFDTTVTLNRKSQGVGPGLHDAEVSGPRAGEILWGLYNGKSAEMKVKGPRGRLLYSRRLDLSGYNRAFKACVTQWRRENAQEQAGR